MPKVACILPDNSLSEQARAIYQKEHEDIYIKTGLLQEAVIVSKELERDGYEVIISRGRTAAMIKEAQPELSVVTVPFTVLDILQTIERAKFHGKRIGLVAFAPMIMNLDHFDSILGASVQFFPLDDESQAGMKVREAIQDHADIIVGGAITGRAAKKLGIPFALIENSHESLLQAAQEAKNISQARQHENAKGNLFRAVLDYASDGVISVDADGIITLFNPVAEKYTQMAATDAVGKHIQQVLPGAQLDKVFKTRKQDLGQLHNIYGEQVVCNKIPICVNDILVGAVLNFQEVSKLQHVEAKVRRRLFSSGHVAKHNFNEIIGSSSKLQTTVSLAKDFAKTESAILVQGETGTGKEIFAQSIHNNSTRQLGPFVALNCAALPAQILESELFGYVGGAFTGSSQKGKAGLFEIAHGGTLFLDEIAEMEYATQGKLLRVLQEKQVMRLGSDRLTPIDVRIIAATNNPLKKLVAENKFRADLFYRLNVLQLRLHPLRDRHEDIIPLLSFFLQKHTNKLKKKPEFTSKALEELKRYNWPGNVRELQNIVERILATLKDTTIDIDMVQQHLEELQETELFTQILNDETEEIRQALLLTKGNHTEAAGILGISRSTLWRKLRKTGLQKKSSA